MAIEYAPIELSHHRITSISSELKGISLPIPFVPNDVNIWFLKLDDGWAVFDCGFNDSHTKQIWEEIIFKEIFPIKAIIVSHFHLDHAALCGWVSQRTDAPLYASREEWFMMHFLKYEPEKSYVEVMKKHYDRAAVPQDIANPSLAQIYIYPHIVSDIPNHFKTLKTDMHIGNWRVQTVKGHAQEMITLHHLTEKMVISCDHILPNINPNVSLLPFFDDSNPLQDYADALESFRHISDDHLILPSHGKPFYHVSSEIERNFGYREARFKKILKACTTYKTAYEVVSTLFKRECPSDFFFYLLGDVWSHIIYLVQANKLITKVENGIPYYKTA